MSLSSTPYLVRFIEPIFELFTICLVLCRHPGMFKSKVFIVFVVEYTIINSFLVRTLRISTELERRQVDVVHGSCHVTTQKGEQ